MGNFLAERVPTDEEGGHGASKTASTASGALEVFVEQVHARRCGSNNKQKRVWHAAVVALAEAAST